LLFQTSRIDNRLRTTHIFTTARKPVSAGAEIDFPAGKKRAEELCTAVDIKDVKPAHAGRAAFCFRNDSRGRAKTPKTSSHSHILMIRPPKSPAIQLFRFVPLCSAKNFLSTGGSPGRFPCAFQN
jgi:hypothetical protein